MSERDNCIFIMYEEGESWPLPSKAAANQAGHSKYVMQTISGPACIICSQGYDSR